MDKKSSKPNFELITSESGLAGLTKRLADAPFVAFDTEFVSEHTYRPVLCLVQIAAGRTRAIVDGMEVRDMAPLWEFLAEPGHTTIVHAGRQEISFALDSINRAPAGLWDVQIAAGLVGTEYPAGYGSLVQKTVGQTVHKSETRTDWRRRPLSHRQLSYAMEDVEHLELIRDKQHAALVKTERLGWFDEEMASSLEEILAFRVSPRWRRTSGIAGLTPRQLAIAREVWKWREAQAEERDRAPRQILRDDLIVELARRGSADEQRIRQVRGFERRNLKNALRDVAAAVRRGLDVPNDECPQPVRRESKSQLNLIGQFLQTALTSLCRQNQVAASLVATASDVRDLVAYRTGGQANGQPPPALACGWRAELIGRLLEDLLEGRIAIQIDDPTSDAPLALRRLAE